MDELSQCEVDHPLPEQEDPLFFADIESYYLRDYEIALPIDFVAQQVFEFSKPQIFSRNDAIA